MPLMHAFFDPLGAFGSSRDRGRALETPRSFAYRDLVGDAWWQLPPPTRARFEGHDALYAGTMTLRATRSGRWIARLCKLVGSPLPPPHDQPVVATVQVERDRVTGGSRWTRCYTFPTKLVTVASVKAVDAEGSLVERLCCGLRMRLALGVRDGALCFDSAGYYIECPGVACRGRRFGALRLPLPSWFLPGRSVAQLDLGDGRFRFTMRIRHPLLGELFDHEGVFRSLE